MKAAFAPAYLSKRYEDLLSARSRYPFNDEEVEETVELEPACMPTLTRNVIGIESHDAKAFWCEPKLLKA